jgi:hypothetical protein
MITLKFNNNFCNFGPQALNHFDSKIDHMKTVEEKTDWKGLINESVHTSDDEDVGDIEAVNRDYVVVKRGFKNVHYYYIPLDQIEGWDRDVLWLKVTKDEVIRNYERNTPPNPSRYYTHARTTIQSPPYDTTKLPELRILQTRYAEPTSAEFKAEAPDVYPCDLCMTSYRSENELSNHVVEEHGEKALRRSSPAVLDWDAVVHKNVRSKDGAPVGNIGGITDNAIVILKGPGREFIVPKVHVEAYNGAEVSLDLPYNDLEASYKRIID